MVTVTHNAIDHEWISYDNYLSTTDAILICGDDWEKIDYKRVGYSLWETRNVMRWKIKALKPLNRW